MNQSLDQKRAKAMEQQPAAPEPGAGELNRLQKPINRATVREIILRRLKEIRGPFLAAKMTRVAPSAFDYLDNKVRRMIEEHLDSAAFAELERRFLDFLDENIRRHPTRGSTIKLPPQL